MRATTPRTGTVRNVLMFVAAPLVALAYVIAGPFVGLAALAWFAVRATRGLAAA